jgi:hypothetical protein
MQEESEKKFTRRRVPKGRTGPSRLPRSPRPLRPAHVESVFIHRAPDVRVPDSVLSRPDPEIDDPKIEAKHTVNMETFVDACELDSRYLEKPYPAKRVSDYGQPAHPYTVNAKQEYAYVPFQVRGSASRSTIFQMAAICGASLVR